MQKHAATPREGTRGTIAKRAFGRLAALVALIAFLAACSTSTPDAVVVELVELSGQSVEDAKRLDGATLEGTVTLSVKENPRYASVAFYLDDPAMRGAPAHVDHDAPFLARLDTTTLADGPHELTVAAEVSRGKAPVTTYAFEVRNGQDEAPAPSEPGEGDAAPETPTEPTDPADPGTGGSDGSDDGPEDDADDGAGDGSDDGSTDEPGDEPGDGWTDPLPGDGGAGGGDDDGETGDPSDGGDAPTEPERPEEPEEPQPGPTPQDPYADLPAPTLFVSTNGSDSNDGRSPARAFRTLEKAGDVARPGDVVEVANGTYRGFVTTRASGTRDARIVYYAETPGGVLLDARGEYRAWWNDGSYVDIIGFEITGADYVGITNMGSYARILHNHIHDLAVPSCNSPRGGAGIMQGEYSARGNEAIGNVVHDIRAPGDCNLVHGIYHANAGGKVQNNIVYNVSSNAIQSWHSATGVTITNNLVWGANIGINVAADAVTARDFYVANNIILNNNYAIFENGSVGTNRYVNNLLHGNRNDFRWRGSPVVEGTLRADPRLIDFRADGSGDYRPTANSPVIDAGVSQGAPEVDLLGTPRPQLGAVDLGPYEMPSYDAWAR